MAEIRAEVARICNKEEYRPLFSKSACNPLEITFDQMTDQSKISPEHKILLQNVRKEGSALNVKGASAYRRYGGAKGADVASIIERSDQQYEDNALSLYSGNISWGEYSKKRKEIATHFRDELNQIVRQK
jgi:hypothetical protein